MTSDGGFDPNLDNERSSQEQLGDSQPSPSNSAPAHARPRNRQAPARGPLPPRGGGASTFATSCVGGAFGCLFAAIAGPIIVLALLMALGSALGDSLDGNFGSGNFQPSASSLREQIIREGPADRKIAVIAASGPLLGSGTAAAGSGPAPVIMRKLQAAGRDGAVKAVLLQVDSPGGGLTASDQIYHQVRRLREKKPVVVYVGGMAASGGYYISAPATHIVVSPTGMVGSFGVIMTRFQIKELLDKIGIKPTPIMSTEMKDLGSPFRELTEEEKAYFKEMMTTYHARFVQIIAEGRGLAEKEVRALADGKLYTAAQAVGHGLADAEGYYEDALKTAVRLGEAKGARIIRYADPFPWQSLLQARAEWTPEAVRGLIEELAAESETPRFEARWRGQGE